MKEWIELFLNEIEKIDNFFNSKKAEYDRELEILKDTLVKKKHGNGKSASPLPTGKMV
jgi:hypothetical protein